MGHRLRACIRAIEYHIPDRVLSNDELASIGDRWTPERIEAKTGIRERRIAATDQCSSDLAVTAAERLFEQQAVKRDEIDFLLLCTQSPDYFLPTTACLVQERLGLPTTVGALDFNLGCSGYIYGLGMAKGLIESGQARRVLLLTAETYSKFIRYDDLNVRTLFGDAAAATLVEGAELESDALGPFVYGTDGKGAQNLIVRRGGLRAPLTTEGEESQLRLFMDGPEIFSFTLTAVPPLVDELFRRTGLSYQDLDLVVFHQANEYMLEHLRSRMEVPKEKFFVSMRHCGNTVSSTIPIALNDAVRSGSLQRGARILAVGFGVGYSWGATILRWNP